MWKNKTLSLTGLVIRRFGNTFTVCAASPRQRADGSGLSPLLPVVPRPLHPLTPHAALCLPPQQPEQCEQQRLPVQRLALPLPQLSLPRPQLQPGPAGTCAAVQRVLPRLRIHVPGRLPVQIPIPNAARGPQPGKGALGSGVAIRPGAQTTIDGWNQGRTLTRTDLCLPTRENGFDFSTLDVLFPKGAATVSWACSLCSWW